ncbi:MAG: flagellar hook-associated protein FlgL [Candidatus Omnitrophica bacterium]|nr:flagellar hook-associated protein FlgL [Candidatus Omnitrophota bacterium]
MRITEQGILRTSLVHIQRHFEKLAHNQEMLASGIRVKVPSDDPIATQRILRWKKVKESVVQYQRNISTVEIWMNTTESIIASVQDIVQRVYELALTAGNELLPQEIRAGLSEEVEALLKEIVTLSNSAVDNNYIFAGHITNTKPFTANYTGGLITSVDYNGDGGQRVVEIGEGNTITVNVLGSNDTDNDGVADFDYPAIFRDANLGVDIFDTLINLRNDLTSGNVVNINSLRIPELEDILDNLAVRRSVVGLSLDAITLAKDILSKEEIDVSEDIDSNEKADLAKVISDINYEQTIYQASLVSTSKLMQGTLFDFIK